VPRTSVYADTRLTPIDTANAMRSGLVAFYHGKTFYRGLTNTGLRGNRLAPEGLARIAQRFASALIGR